MKNLLFVSLFVFVLLFSSCSSLKKGCSDFTSSTLYRQDICPIIAVSDSLQSFDIEVSIVGKRINGMMLVKRQSGDTARVIVNSYFGMSMMDFELSPRSAKMHYMFEGLNKLLIHSLFEENFKLLFGYNLPDTFFAKQTTCNKADKLITFEADKGTYLYRVDANNCPHTIKTPGIKAEIFYENGTKIVKLNNKGLLAPNIVVRELSPL